MQEIEFNLLTEPWVRVRLPDNAVQEVSLTDALVHAQEYMDLAGEMPTQDAAMLRLLLAVLFTVFSRVNEVGEPLEDEEAALERWGALWELKHFPEQPIRDYLEQWKDRFWLFHPERPFWQVPEAKIGSPFKGGKLNGEVFESENKNNMFASYAGVEKNALTYAQAARWLVFLNNYDDADQIAMSLSLLNELGRGWQNRITEEIGRCEQAASLVGHLAQDIATAAGDKNENASAPARSQFYFAVDQPFRQWLRSIDPEEDDMTETTARWQVIARGIAEQLGQQMVLEAGSAALVGHRVKLDAGKKTERMELYTAPKAYNRFRAGLYKLYPKTNDEGGTA